MALQLPGYLETKSPQYLYELMRQTYNRSAVGQAEPKLTCTDRPYDMEICLGQDHDGIRYGTFNRCMIQMPGLGGFKCTSGHFFSKKVQFGGADYELRVGHYAEGSNAGQYGVTIGDAKDTQHVASVVENWNVNGDDATLSAALQQACQPLTERFTRRLDPISAASQPNLSPTEVATDIVVSGIRTYCASPADTAKTLDTLNTWWSQFQSYVSMATQAIATLAPKHQPQGQEDNTTANDRGQNQSLAQNQNR